MNNLQRFYHLGMDEKLSSFEARKLILVNRLVVLCSIICIMLAIPNAIFGVVSGLVSDLVGLLILIPVLLLNRVKKYAFANYFFTIGITLLVTTGTVLAIHDGRSTESENLIIPFSIIIVILFQGVPQFLMYAFAFVAMLFAKYYRYVYNNEPVGDEFYLLSNIMIITFFGTYYFITFFKNQLIKTLIDTEKLNEQLKKKELELSRSNKSKERLFSIISHDLRSPIQIFQGILDPGFAESLDKKQFLQYQNVIRSKLKVLKDTLNNLLSWASTQLNEFSTRPEEVSVLSVVDESLLLYKDLSSEKDIDVHVEIDPDHKAMVDLNHISIVVRNIIHNAMKFTPFGGEIIIETKAQDGDLLSIIVQDTGLGMEQEMIDKILNGELSKSTVGTAGEHGTGIGLSFCNDLLKKNNAIMNIKASLKNGTRFEIVLPLVPQFVEA